MKKFMLFFILAMLPGWLSIQAQDVPGDSKARVEVYYFHATMRCPTCLAVEEQTRKTLDENFAGEIKSGTLQLKVLNLEEKENKALTEKFEIGWSSLILYVPASNKTVNLTEDAFANARTHPDEFRKELQEKIKELL
jgi:hypothetical protein